LRIERLNISISSDVRRVLLRPFEPTTSLRAQKILDRILSLSPQKVQKELETILTDFENRHRNLKEYFLHRYSFKEKVLQISRTLNMEQKLLIGAYFTMEYSPEAAALFNPSIVWHPKQERLTKNTRKFVLSLRATGEGHVSSLTFRSGIINSNFQIELDEPNRFLTSPEIKECENGYEATFDTETDLADRIIFPNSSEESMGIEDARFVEFEDDSGNKSYYATYTAYDGKNIRQRMISSKDFIRFKIKNLNGKEIQNKGLALFPRKVNGQYAMLSRQDNENNFIMFSDDIYTWNEKQLLMEPQYSWEFVQLGNCGSPIETEQGWLIISHAVGALRKYVITAFLLDLDDPTRVIGRLDRPLISPNEDEREGYVPNVVYSCGSLLYKNKIIIPYAMSDKASGFILVNLSDLWSNLIPTS